MPIIEGTEVELLRKSSRVISATTNALAVTGTGASGSGLDINSIPANTATVRTSQDLSAGALDFTTTVGQNFKIEQIEINFSTTVTEIITITQVDDDGNYNTNPWKDGSATARDDFRYTPSLDGDIKCYDSEEVRIQCTNAGTTGIAYVKVSYSY